MVGHRSNTAFIVDGERFDWRRGSKKTDGARQVFRPFAP